MKAITQSRYGEPHDVLELRDVDRPEPADHEVLVRVHASSVNPADRFELLGLPYVLRLLFGLARPKAAIRGKDVAGTVEAVGARVTRWRPGTAVFGELSAGAYAEFVVAGEDVLAAAPAGLGLAEAAAVPLAGVTALQGLRDAGGVRPGHRVLVNGASGGVGTFAVQIAKALGAHVTGVCSGPAVDLVTSIGADEVVDYTREDCTRSAARYDVVFDLVGSHPPAAYRRVLHRGGVYVAATGMPGGSLLGPLPFLLRVVLASLRGGPRMKPFAAKPGPDALAALAELIESGRVRPVIDRTYALADAAAALARQGQGHARGKTVVTVAETASPTDS
ncbi:NADPH:quinone reductase-like Zn-dependent oxidoreductase [Nocardiopsis sp. Huas11]|uniref:NAD(P)-dependent alcohol dehydrogenase n=1 Tax=Nocardiopsis sp. Huas11 TaxID=2183912 RepID=UPI000EAB83CC|nr:NAD(P)-dependent alcohol dehydrogenase [Nocardiopsis sp. Huas11]RKS05129.1 NADPH:quinone reductase-like Zn-dependent oxidoreductase [Nocardiopsis sp. Huas11]